MRNQIGSSLNGLPRRVLARRRPLRLVLVMAGLLVLGLFGPVSSRAAEREPSWSATNRLLIVHSTRVILHMQLLTERLATRWKAEVAQAPCGGAVPSEGWKLINEEELKAEESNSATLEVGAHDPGDEASGPSYVRGLRPGTCYDARFSATNAASPLNGKGEPQPAVAVVPFETLPVKPPEVPRTGSQEQLHVYFTALELAATTQSFEAKVEANGADSTYAFEYSLPEAGHAPAPGASSWTLFSSGGEGGVTAAQDFAHVRASTTGLTAETTYYVRLKLHNEKGTTLVTRYTASGDVESETFTTGTLKPQVFMTVANVTGASAHVSAAVYPHGLATAWRFEFAASEPGGCPSASSAAWTLVPGGAGSVSQAQAQATKYYSQIGVGVTLSGLSASASYCVRVSASNEAGGVLSAPTSFETDGPPAVQTFAVHRLLGESLEVLGSVNPKNEATSEEQIVTVSGAAGGTFTLSLEGHVTAPIAFDAPGQLEVALRGLPSAPNISVEGVAGGPYTVRWVNEGVPRPLLAADGSALTPSPGAGVAVSEAQRGGESTGVEFWFQYVSDRAFEASGWSAAQETAHQSAGTGESPSVVGVLVPGLAGGEGYRFRVLAGSAFSSSPVVGVEQRLTVPATPVVEGSSCSNEAFRTGLSSVLPDCRAYEQLSPFLKGGAQEPFHYHGGIQTAVLAGEEGDHAVLEAEPVTYGTGTGSGQSPYLFSRGEGGWSMTAAAAQPETGVRVPRPQVYSADLTKIAFMSEVGTSDPGQSPELEYELGPVGGPYAKVVSVPRALEANDAASEKGWVAGNGDLSKLVLRTADHELLGGETGTRSGSDLYEYTNAGGLVQLNVTGSGAQASTIGACGAQMVSGEEDTLPAAPVGHSARRASSSHSVSSDGSRVFFEAVPARDCSQPQHLYMRVGGAETVDVGAYRFMAADANAATLLVRNAAGEMFGYDTQKRTLEPEPVGSGAEEAELALVGIPSHHDPQPGDAFARPRYMYLGALDEGGDVQAARYDSVEHLLECISCASSYDPAPKHPAFMGDLAGVPEMNGGLPDFTAASADGRFAFFTTVSALVPGDIDGEHPAEFLYEPGDFNGEFTNAGGHASPSTDVYEWRAAGVNGCGLVQGCVALITDGRGGYLNLFLGTAHEGRDVFFYSRSALVPGDPAAEGAIAEGNIYDARIGGGFAPPPPRPVECSGTQCAPPAPPPADLTPASLTFNGPGNLVQPLAAKPPPPPAHVVKCRRGYHRLRNKCLRTPKRRAKHAHKATHAAHPKQRTSR